MKMTYLPNLHPNKRPMLVPLTSSHTLRSLDFSSPSYFHPAVGIGVAGGEVGHGVQSQQARRGPQQVLTWVTVVL